MSFEMVCGIKLFCQQFFWTYFLHINYKYCYGFYYRTYTCVQLCWHDAIDEWYGLLQQFVMFGEFFDKKIVIY